jgi:hypothetical protein
VARRTERGSSRRAVSRSCCPRRSNGWVCGLPHTFFASR